MKIKKNLIFILAIIFIITIVFSYIIIHTNKISIADKQEVDIMANLPKKRFDINYVFKANFSNPEIAMDYYPYAFIAKVNKIIKTEYRDPTEIETVADGSQTEIIYKPYTIYDITVIENLKGEIIKNTNIPIEQVGGISQDNNSIVFPTGMDFLKENYYYIMLPYAADDTNELVLEAAHNVIELGELNDNTVKNSVLEIAKASKINELEADIEKYELSTEFNSVKNIDTNLKENNKVEGNTINEAYIREVDMEKINQNEITKTLTYKYASMSPVDMKYYEELAKSQGVKDYTTFYFATNMSKYDVNYGK